MTPGLGYYSLDPLFLDEESVNVILMIWLLILLDLIKGMKYNLGQIYTSWVTLPLHCLFLFLATVTKERAIPGTQLAGLWQTLMYGCPLTRFQVNLANCACKEFEHIPDWIFRIKPAFTRYQMLDVPSWSKNWDASGAPTPHDVLRKQSCFHLFHHLMAFSHHKIAIIKSCSLMTLRNL